MTICDFKKGGRKRYNEFFTLSQSQSDLLQEAVPDPAHPHTVLPALGGALQGHLHMGPPGNTADLN